MQIRQLDTTWRQDVHQFVQFPFTLYRDSLQWVPPLTSGVEKTLDRDRHPFYSHSAAKYEILLVFLFLEGSEGGKAIGIYCI
jgi:hypothetical protein